MFSAKTPLLNTASHVYIFCSHIMYGDLRDIHTIFKIDGVAAVLFLLPFTFMTYIGLTNMFTAIILSSFCDV